MNQTGTQKDIRKLLFGMIFKPGICLLHFQLSENIFAQFLSDSGYLKRVRQSRSDIIIFIQGKYLRFIL